MSDLPDWEREARAANRYCSDVYEREQRERRQEDLEAKRERLLRYEDPADLGILPGQKKDVPAADGGGA